MSENIHLFYKCTANKASKYIIFRALEFVSQKHKIALVIMIHLALPHTKMFENEKLLSITGILVEVTGYKIVFHFSVMCSGLLFHQPFSHQTLTNTYYS